MPPGQKPGWEMAKRQAADELLRLERTYVTALQDQSVVVALYGPAVDQDAFATLARPEGALTVDVRDLYRDLADKVQRSVSPTSKSWGVDQHVQTLERTLAIAYDLGITSVINNAGAPFRARDASTYEAIFEACRDTVRERFGDEVPAAWVRTRVREAAQAAGLAPDGTVPVLLVGARDQQEASALLAGWPALAASAVLAKPGLTADAVVKVFQRTRKQRRA